MYVDVLGLKGLCCFLADDEQHNFSILTILISVMRKVVMLS